MHEQTLLITAEKGKLLFHQSKYFHGTSFQLNITFQEKQNFPLSRFGGLNVFNFIKPKRYQKQNNKKKILRLKVILSDEVVIEKSFESKILFSSGQVINFDPIF